MESFTGVVKRAKSGDEVAFTEIFNAYNNKIYYFALNHVKSAQDAEDIVQSTFTEVFRSLGALSDETVFKSWLYTIAKRQIIKLYQKTERTLGVHTEDIDVIADGLWDNREFLPENILQTEEMKSAVADLIRSLPDVQKTSVLLYYYEEMSVKEIAEIQECSVGTVKSRLNYARKYIRAEIEKRRKKGNYVIGVAPLPLLTLLLREMAARDTLSQETATAIFKESCTAADIVLTEATAGLIITQAGGATTGSVGAVSSVSAAAKGGMTLLTKAIIAGVGLCAVIAVAVFILINSPDVGEDYVPAFAYGDNELSEAVSDIEAGQMVDEGVDMQDATPHIEPEHIHVWADATCQVPQVCTECGETYGEPIPHELTAANFQHAAVCIVCGEAEGEPLASYFAGRGLVANLQVGVAADYVTATFADYNVLTFGTATITNYQVVPYDHDHEARDGYEWRIVTFATAFSDDDNWYDGNWPGLAVVDYFSGWLPRDVTEQYNAPRFQNVAWGEKITTQINYMGEPRDIAYIVRSISADWSGRQFTQTMSVAVQVPVGYDGIVLALFNRAHARGMDWDDFVAAHDVMGAVIDGGTLFFRLD